MIADNDIVMEETQPPVKHTKHIKHIVINGGGPLLINMYGALKQSNVLEMWKHEHMESYYGTSAGAILATIMALKYDWDTLDNYIINRPWQQILKFNILEIYDYYTNNGITDEKFIKEIFSPLLKAKDIDVDVTMETFAQITGVKLHLYATEFETFKVQEFSAEATPNVKVLDAVYASSALPILLKPIKIEDKFYIDGSIYMNYPIAKCLERNSDPQTILGIKNAFTLNATSEINNMNMFDYLSYIMNAMFIKAQSCEMNSNRDQIKEITITSTFNDLSNFFKMASSSEERRNAINRGIADAIKLLHACEITDAIKLLHACEITDACI